MSVSVIRQDGQGSWTFDSCTSEEYSTEIEVTEHPIEEGSEVADHAREKPLPISLRGFVTGTPFDSDFKANEPNRQKKAIEFFSDLTGVLVTVVSQRLGSFENCLLTGYPHTVEVRDGLGIQASFKQERIAVSEQVDLPPEKPAPRHSASVSDEQDVGKQPLSEDEQALYDHFANKGNGVFFY